MSKTDVLARIKSEKIIALIRADSAASLLECARALSAGGLNCIELTMTTPGALELCAQVSQELPGVLLGLGTVLDADTARAGIAAGAKFIVTPCLRPTVIAVCRAAGVPILSGALTPTEAYNAHELGADVIKIFPAEFFGPAYIKSVRAPFPNIALVPTGGVNAENVGEFIKAGAFATAAGSSLVDAKTLKEKNWALITSRAKAFVAAVAAV
jgi:2-dehydro-3-deoxyphosphogluconate aldolase / (4S)-4-hydroxy-2-oxoglutarate aldolase